MEIPMANHIKVPKKVRDRKAEQFQGWLIAAALGAGVISWLAFSNGAAETGFWSSLICGGTLFIASKIKTKRDYNSSNYD